VGGRPHRRLVGPRWFGQIETCRSGKITTVPGAIDSQRHLDWHRSRSDWSASDHGESASRQSEAA